MHALHTTQALPRRRPEAMAFVGTACHAPQVAQSAALQRLGRWAVVSLYDEVALYPKPGLVSFVDSGSHHDMNGQTFLRSLFALRHYFGEMVRLGHSGAAFATLEQSGMQAEAAMWRATGQVNTHRGAIFSLGLLSAAAGAALAAAGGITPSTVREHLVKSWGPALSQRAQRASRLPGGIAAHRHGLRGASEEAALGFPVLFDVTWPALSAALGRGWDLRTARLQALLQTMAVMDDCNLAHRGGLHGLHWARQAAATFIADGGMAQPDAHARLQQMHRAFVAQRLSPGGAADMLAAACWLHRAQTLA